MVSFGQYLSIDDRVNSLRALDKRKYLVIISRVVYRYPVFIEKQLLMLKLAF